MLRKSSSASGVRLITLIVAFIPLVMFLGMASNLVVSSLDAIREVGLETLFSTSFSNVFSGIYSPGQYGLLPSMYGTFLLAVVALVFALPVSLAMAVLSSEFSINGWGQVLEPVMTMISGMPPVLYGLISSFFLTTFIVPKFAGQGLSADIISGLPGLPQGNMLLLLPQFTSTLLGGILLGLLIIPFMMPIILDAIRSVPAGQKEASLALGATRWYTLWHVTLPGAISGIVAAISLGSLKAIGDVVIVSWAIGYVADGMPFPLWDFFESKAPLSAVAAGMLSGLKKGADPRIPVEQSVAYFSGLLLFVVAFVMLAVVQMVQRYFRRKMSQ